MRVFRTGMPALNQARAEHGLVPLRDLGDVLNAVGRVLVCTSPSYDFAADDVPANVRYVGPQLDDAPGGGTGETWDDPGGRPLVLVGHAARVVYAGAGLRVSRKASTADLGAALGRVLDEPRFRAGARRMAATLAAERDDGLVVDELEQTAALSHSANRDPSSP